MTWYADYPRGYLGRLDPSTGAVKEWASPSGPESQPYEIAVMKGCRLVERVRPEAQYARPVRSENREFPESRIIPSGGIVVRNMMATKDGNLDVSVEDFERWFGAYTITSLMRLVNHWRWFFVLTACMAGCRAGPPLTVTQIQLGRSLNSDGTVGSFATTFAPGETVYVSVRTAGVGDATISVRWTYEGRVVGEPKKQVSFKDVAATEFHLQAATGFPPGHYTVEVFMNGQSVETRRFTVEKR